MYSSLYNEYLPSENITGITIKVQREIFCTRLAAFLLELVMNVSNELLKYLIMSSVYSF